MMGKRLMGGLLCCAAILVPSKTLAEVGVMDQQYANPYTLNELVQTDGKCAHLAKSPCTQVKVRYPRFQSPTSSAATDAMNAEVQRFLLHSIADEQTPPNLETAMSRFIQRYHSASREFPRQGVWADEKQVEVISNRSSLLSLQYSHYWYTGGAHPNSSRTYWNFNPQTGQQIQLKELLVEGYEPKLNTIAERYFRKVRNLEADASLSEAGFWFENDRFQVNTNFVMAPKGLIFFFNPYEIGPYVLGSTEVQIPYAALKGLFQDQSQSWINSAG